MPLSALSDVGDMYKQRFDIVLGYKANAASDSKALVLAGTHAEAATAAWEFSKKTDATFSKLKVLGLTDKKFQAYEEYWGGLVKPELQANPRSIVTTTKVGLFPDELAKAAKGGMCTLVISASKGEGAAVHYAKFQDADVGRSFRQLAGTTTIIQEVERAEYVFKCIRNGRETGKTGIVACLDSKTPVKVVIPE